MTQPVRLILIFLATFITSSLSGQDKLYVTHSTEGREILVNGNFSDEAWNYVEWAGDFTQNEPSDGKTPTFPTYFKILYDNDNLYVAIRALDNEPALISRRLTRRDVSEGDKVGVYLDSYFDKRTAFCFIVNAAGVKIDYTLSNEEYDDLTWDPIWKVKTLITSEGWNAEISIPLTQLRFNKEKDQTWGLQVVRRIFRNEELSSWKYFPRNSSGYVSQFGVLMGISGIQPRKEIEFMPFTVAGIDTYKHEEGNPFSKGTDLKLNIGLDGKIALTNDLTLNYTVNPDFGQVEADPSEVNLSTYETFFEEKRPFFIEGKNIFNYNLTIGDGNLANDNLFYSRRIGRTPHDEPDLDDGEFSDIPTETTILGAFKLSGKTKAGLSVGAMEIITGRERASIGNEGNKREITVEPLTNYSLARFQKDFNKGKTIFGGMLTSTNRFLEDSNLFFLPKSALTGGFDFVRFWHKKDYYLSVKTVFSEVKGKKEAITDLQESPVRYYQRPDASHLSFDPDRTSLAGHGGTIEFAKQGGGHFQVLSWISWRSPGLELNDMGYLRQADEIQEILWCGYRIFKPTNIFRSLNLQTNQYKGFDFGGLQKYSGYNINFNGQFLNYWFIGSGVNRDEAGYATSELRGGPALRNPGGISNWYYLETDNRKKFKIIINYSHYWGDQHYCDFDDFSLSLVYRPVESLCLTFTPVYNRGFNDLQYVDDLTWMDQKRYIISNIDREEISAVVRLDMSLSPDLTIQYYGQPFIFSAHYHGYKRVTAPRAREVKNQYQVFAPDQVSINPADKTLSFDENLDGDVDYTIDNPDFSFFQFRSNLVVRWEFQAGSTFFLIWSQGRTGDESLGKISLHRGMNNLLDLYPQNIFMVKLSYRIHTW